MRDRWSVVLQKIKPGSVFRDNEYIHSDGTLDEKWFIILSDVVESNYWYCLTTSKVNTTYKNVHFSKIIKTSDKPFPIPTIIEIERVDAISIDIIQKKYDENKIEYKGCIDPLLLEEIFDKQRESISIPDDIKEHLKLFEF